MYFWYKAGCELNEVALNLLHKHNIKFTECKNYQQNILLQRH